MPDESPKCAGCGTTEPPLHELTVGIYACDNCIEVTLEGLRQKPEDSRTEAPNQGCNSY